MAVNLTKSFIKSNIKYGWGAIIAYKAKNGEFIEKEEKEEVEKSFDCRVSFNVINLMYKYLVKKNKVRKGDYDNKFWDGIGVYESYLSDFLNGKMDKFTYGRDNESKKIVKATDITSGKIKYTLNGVSKKQWSQYFNIIKHIEMIEESDIYNKYGEDEKKRALARAKAIRKKYEKMFYKKIANLEMNADAYNFYIRLSEYLFKKDKSVEAWIHMLDEMTEEKLLVLRKHSRDNMIELHNKMVEKCKLIKEVDRKC